MLSELQNLAGAKSFTCLDEPSSSGRRSEKENCSYIPRMMNDILHDYIQACAMVYLDDTTIFSKTKWEHIENVFTVVRKPKKGCLVLNEGKCCSNTAVAILTVLRGLFNITDTLSASLQRRRVQIARRQPSQGPLYHWAEECDSAAVRRLPAGRSFVLTSGNFSRRPLV